MIVHRRLPAVLITVAISFCATALAAAGPWKEHDPHEFGIQPGPGVTSQGWISEYHAPLAETVADTPYFVLEGDEPGGTLFVLGGTHATETSGIIAAILLVETAVVERGRLVVVPYGNPLAARTDRTVSFDTPTGARSLMRGNRRALADLHEDDPEDGYEGPSGASFSANEGRNLNRVWPGVADGTGTEQIAYALMRLMEDQATDVAFDLHETGSAWGDLAWTLAGRSEHEDLIREACRRTNAAIAFDVTRPRIDDDRSGLSRVEWGPALGVVGLLTETVRGNHTPLDTRVGLQVEWILAVLEVLNEDEDEDIARIELTGIPGYEQLTTRGLGEALQPAPE